MQKKNKEESLISVVYLALLSVSYFIDSIEAVKLIPVFIAFSFSGIFMYSAWKKQALIYKFTKKFYKKKMAEKEEEFLKKGDSFWAYTIFLYALILLFLVYKEDDLVWGIFSSVGWYVYFLLALLIQIIYGKFYVVKMHLK